MTGLAWKREAALQQQSEMGQVWLQMRLDREVGTLSSGYRRTG